MKNETWTVYFTDGTKSFLFCKKNEIEDYITVAQFRKLDRIEQMNREADKVHHKSFTITL